MKKFLVVFSAIAMLCAAPAAHAFEAKSETQMKHECTAKWKTDATKIQQCMNGKKGYQARMLKKGGASSHAAKHPAKAASTTAAAPAAAAAAPKKSGGFFGSFKKPADAAPKN